VIGTVLLRHEVIYLRVDLGNVERESELRRQDFLEAQSMQEHSNSHSSCVKQMKALNKAHVIWLDQTEKDHEVNLKSKEIFGPKVKDLDHCCPYFVELFKILASCFVPCPGIPETGDGEPWSHQNKRIEHKNELHNSADQIGSQGFS
jgi:hypothetical protein